MNHHVEFDLGESLPFWRNTLKTNFKNYCPTSVLSVCQQQGVKYHQEGRMSLNIPRWGKKERSPNAEKWKVRRTCSFLPGDCAGCLQVQALCSWNFVSALWRPLSAALCPPLFSSLLKGRVKMPEKHLFCSAVFSAKASFPVPLCPFSRRDVQGGTERTWPHPGLPPT